jgi:hypothetical protein
MYVSVEVIAIAAVAASLLLLAYFVLRRRTTPPAIQADEFVFSSQYEMDRQRFVLEVAGLIKAATALETRISKGGPYPELDIEVLRGMRRVGVVSVVPPGQDATAEARIRAIARIKAERQVKTAYIVTGGLLDSRARRLAGHTGVVALDGPALQRIQRKIAAGVYAKKAQPTPELTPAEAKRWQRPKPATRIANVTEVDPLAVTQERRLKLPPWVEFR